MKKTSLVNLIIIVGLLVMCVMTLIAVYATTPESTVLLIDETFNRLDDNKWSHKISKCKEEGELFHYEIENGNTSGLIANGVLQIRPDLKNVEFRSKREIFTNCSSCVDSKYLNIDCDSSLFFANVEAKNVFDANKGRIKLRAKLQSRKLLKFCIEIISSSNNSKSDEALEKFSTLASETTKNFSSEFRIFIKSTSNDSVINSEITDNEFHDYEIFWDCKKISLKIDNKKVEEKEFEMTKLAEENNSNKSVKFNSAPINQPFYLKVGVEFEEKELNLSASKSFSNQNERDLDEKNVLEIDYIQLFRILN